MKKFLLSFLFFLFACANAWGADKYYSYHGAFKKCSIAKTTVSEQTQFTLTMGVRAKNTNGGANFTSTLTLILLSTDGTLEGTYLTKGDDDNKITDATNLVYSTDPARHPYDEEVSTITITKIGAPDNYYRVSSGELHLTAVVGSNTCYYNYTFCYGLDGSGNVDDSETSYYDFKDIMSSITGTGSNLTLTLSGRGAMDNYEDDNSNRAPWYNDRSNIKHIIIEEGITAIGEYAFHGCNVEDITIPVSVKSFGARAFYSRGTSMSNNYIYYAGTPNEWADINFTAVDGYPSSHPFYNVLSSKNHIYFYNQKTTETTNIVFTPGLTTIRPYVFYFAGNITNVNIPNSVTSIGTKAFNHCSSLCRIFVNNTTAPTAATDAFESMVSGASSSWLYLPEGANPGTGDGGFKKLPWYDSTYSGKGPARVGYQGIDVSGVSAVSSFGLSDSKVYPRTGTVDGITWTLGNDGVMTFSGSGAITTVFTDKSGDATYNPWMRWRYLVNKVVITGSVTGLSNALDIFNALTEININQAKVPTASASLPTLIHGGTIALNVNPAALADASGSNLGSTPWTDAKFGNVTLSSAVSIADNAECETLLANIHNYVEEPFDMNVTRSMSNAYYNTFCSPIDMNSTLVESIFGAGTKIYSFAGTSYTEETDELSLNFNESQDYIEAGVPYLIWPANNVSDPSFTNVDPDDVATTAGTVEGTHATFYGTLAPVDVSSAQISAKSFIFLQANNTLNWASEGTLYGMRAYWLLTGDVPARALARRPVMKIGQSTTAIESVQTSDIRSQKIMRNGQIYIVRGEQMYNAQGQMIK